MLQNYFQATKDHPYHLSVGAVLMNDRKEICCHYFDSFSHESLGTFNNFYLLMRETIEPNETIEECLMRGLMEEFGAKANIKSYLGSIVSKFEIRDSDIWIEKTTIYFLCDLLSIDESMRKKGDVDAQSSLQWLDPADLISKMKEQGKRLNREDADESAIVERVF